MVTVSYFFAAWVLGWCVSHSILYFKRLTEVSS